jgi:hypothetical protein
MTEMNRTQEKPQLGKPVAYYWALDADGVPLPITQAERGGRYFCPLCGGAMVARRGDHLRHHFGHEIVSQAVSPDGCPPDAVSRAALRRWIALRLREYMRDGKAFRVDWQCANCTKRHDANLLGGISQISEQHMVEGVSADVVLLDNTGKIRAAILIENQGESLDVRPFTNRDILTMIVPATLMPANLDALRGRVIGTCPTVQGAVRDKNTIRRLLKQTVARHPGYFYAAVEPHEGIAHTAKVGDILVWLPLEHWREIFGGTGNQIAPHVKVWIQTLPHDDGGLIGLFYVTVRGKDKGTEQVTEAVGVRRYLPGTLPAPSLDARFRHARITAFEVARALVVK